MEKLHIRRICMEFRAEMLRKVLRADEPSVDAFVNRISSEPEPEKKAEFHWEVE